MKTDLFTKCTLVFTGICAGLVNGLLGGGGGTLVVPLLTCACGFTQKKAQATALLIILPLSVASGLAYATLGSLKWGVALPSAIGMTAGGILGALALKCAKNGVISKIFACMMLLVGIKFLFF